MKTDREGHNVPSSSRPRNDLPSGCGGVRGLAIRIEAERLEAQRDLIAKEESVPAALKDFYADVIQVERLREVRALVGFTRLDAPDPDDPNLVRRAPLARSDPQWVPASEVRGEGIFLRVPEDLLSAWEERVAGSRALERHRDAYAHHLRAGEPFPRPALHRADR